MQFTIVHPMTGNQSESTDRLFKEYYLAWGGEKFNLTLDEQQLPGFFQRVPQDHEVLPQKLREEARAVLLEHKNHELLDNEELQVNHTVPYFTASVFSKLMRNQDRLSRISIMSFFNYVMKKVWLQQTRIGISLYDASGEGYLREMDLENYIVELIPSLCQVRGLFLCLLPCQFHSFACLKDSICIAFSEFVLS
ncbi:Serine/threonine-protein phosphatase 2A regulatory subunit B'' subunit gamma [Fasciola gigantica]|uniref:Serine/threonine-protein phosphatase 2A regulatory subunit B'' subunit gamma n=1 Tax=Fasciola gigantica TaxID=46835 RepID=A0A504YTM9_FASGI|nr:Serine/threonine-protein phosphatase 2A regulatory subunit B'' subunit gamma [Fasciola gigantica]